MEEHKILDYRKMETLRNVSTIELIVRILYRLEKTLSRKVIPLVTMLWTHQEMGGLLGK